MDKDLEEMWNEYFCQDANIEEVKLKAFLLLIQEIRDLKYNLEKGAYTK